jgi:hypothetical protein
VVVEEALRWHLDPKREGYALREALEALVAERAGKTPAELVEVDITYGQVVEGDEILSPKLGRWYEVTAVVAQANGKVRVTMPKTGRPAGQGKPQRNAWHDFDPTAAVRVRRGETGQAVDMFASVLYSGASRVTEKIEPGPTFMENDPATDPEASEPETPEEEDE